ncbi:hypothetical protein Bbelb_203270 [Branchiostoma belcheri]|nr:hypothetical protein Bbelb_203270 [Branchiostoma belcheri]
MEARAGGDLDSACLLSSTRDGKEARAGGTALQPRKYLYTAANVGVRNNIVPFRTHACAPPLNTDTPLTYGKLRLYFTRQALWGNDRDSDINAEVKKTTFFLQNTPSGELREDLQESQDAEPPRLLGTGKISRKSGLRAEFVEAAPVRLPEVIGDCHIGLYHYSINTAGCRWYFREVMTNRTPHVPGETNSRRRLAVRANRGPYPRQTGADSRARAAAQKAAPPLLPGRDILSRGFGAAVPRGAPGNSLAAMQVNPFQAPASRSLVETRIVPARCEPSAVSGRSRLVLSQAGASPPRCLVEASVVPGWCGPVRLTTGRSGMFARHGGRRGAAGLHVARAAGCQVSHQGCQVSLSVPGVSGFTKRARGCQVSHPCNPSRYHGIQTQRTLHVSSMTTEVGGGTFVVVTSVITNTNTENPQRNHYRSQTAECRVFVPAPLRTSRLNSAGLKTTT